MPLDKFREFTPGVPLQFEGTKAIQIVDGKKRVLHPNDVAFILEHQRAKSMSDEDIRDWLRMV